MDNLHNDQSLTFIKTDFRCVFLLNGTFSENADGFLYSKKEPLYITVFPLNAHLLPYTIKFLGAKALENELLSNSFSFEDKTYIKLLPRYNYVYTANKVGNSTELPSTPERLFAAVKASDFDLSKKYLSQNLLSTIDDNGLEAFFEGYTAIVKDDFKSKNKNAQQSMGEDYFLINDKNEGTKCSFEIFDGLVDNIVVE